MSQGWATETRRRSGISGVLWQIGPVDYTCLAPFYHLLHIIKHTRLKVQLESDVISLVIWACEACSKDRTGLMDLFDNTILALSV